MSLSLIGSLFITCQNLLQLVLFDLDRVNHTFNHKQESIITSNRLFSSWKSFERNDGLNCLARWMRSSMVVFSRSMLIFIVWRRNIGKYSFSQNMKIFFYLNFFEIIEKKITTVEQIQWKSSVQINFNGIFLVRLISFVLNWIEKFRFDRLGNSIEHATRFFFLDHVQRNIPNVEEKKFNVFPLDFYHLKTFSITGVQWRRLKT